MDSHETNHRFYSLFISEEESPHNENDKEFYTHMRAHVIYFITILVLYTFACWLISYFSKQNEEIRVDIEEYRTYKISTWMCAFTLAISIAAILLLPISITVNELNWTNDSRKWSPLAESEGFAGSRRGLSSRLRETCVLLIIVTIIVVGLMYTVCCLFFGIGCYTSSVLTIWQYLSFLYSCISFIGALLLLSSTPSGISHLFTVINRMDSLRKSRKLKYTTSVLLLSLTAYSLFLVAVNVLQVLVGSRMIKPESDSSLDEMIEQQRENNQSGMIRASVDIVMTLYLWSASLCGLYNLPRFSCLRPKKHKCSFNQIIGNCTLLCLLSSALPLSASTLGMTKFVLLADFGRIEWLGNYYIVLLYNVAFLFLVALCLASTRVRN